MHVNCTLGSSQFTCSFKWQGFLQSLQFLRSSWNSHFVFWLYSRRSIICLHFYTSIYGFFVTIPSKHLTGFNFTLRVLLLGFFFLEFCKYIIWIQNKNSPRSPMLWNHTFQRDYITCHSLPTSFLHQIRDYITCHPLPTSSLHQILSCDSSFILSAVQH